MYFMRNLEPGNGISFETVVVDEAARVNPLDLFIPMSMAKRRIVLVGDHRQLPQLLEPDIEHQLAETEGLDQQQQDSLKESLFERLFNFLKKQEQQDGIPRTVTLDTQYRMHPVLGKFVSDQFYEREGDPEIMAGLPAEHFNHGIDGYTNKVATWLNVPIDYGIEQRSGSSWCRDPEAERIAIEVASLTKQYPNKSIGVITFYRGQQDRILQALGRKGIYEQVQGQCRSPIASANSTIRDCGNRSAFGLVPSTTFKERSLTLCCYH
jgi:superfamily I DNA and/or RNA helicase